MTTVDLTNIFYPTRFNFCTCILFPSLFIQCLTKFIEICGLYSLSLKIIHKCLQSARMRQLIYQYLLYGPSEILSLAIN